MAMSPTDAAAPPAPMPEDAGAADPGAAGDDGTEEAGDEDVLLTVCKEPDGTYSLIKGDEQDADGADAAGSATEEGTGKQTFDSVGSLLKAILDVLKADQESGGGEGGDQFQAGFDENAPPKPSSPMAQKY